MRADSEAQFTAFVQEHGDGLTRFARLLASNRHDAEDLLQVALMRVYRRWSNASVSPVAYTKTTLVNLAKDGHRARPAPRPTDDVEALSSASDPDIAAAIVAQAQIETLLAQLPPRQRVTVVLRVIDGLSTEETASQMDCSTGTVKSNLARGLERLRALMDQTHELQDTVEVER